METLSALFSHGGSVGVVLLLGVLDLLEGVGGLITISADIATGGAGLLMVGPRFLGFGTAPRWLLIDVEEFEPVVEVCKECCKSTADFD